MQRHCYFRATAKFGVEYDSESGIPPSFDSENSTSAAYNSGTSAYWESVSDPDGNVEWYSEKVIDLQVMMGLLEVSKLYWDPQATSYDCVSEGLAYNAELFHRYHYSLLLPYLPKGTAQYDGYPFSDGPLAPPPRRPIDLLVKNTIAAVAVVQIAQKMFRRRRREVPPPMPPPALPPFSHHCDNACLGATCESLQEATCDQLADLGCDCGGCCSLPASCYNSCLGTTCEALQEATCNDLAGLGCDCEGCCNSA